MEYLSALSRFFIVIVLLLAAWGKTTTFSRFRDGLADMVSLTPVWRTPFAVALICAEWLLALALLLDGPWRSGSMLAALVLFTLFALTIAVLLIQNKRVSCNCFGHDEGPLTRYDLYRALILVAACAAMLVYRDVAAAPSLPAQILLSGCAFLFVQLTLNLSQSATMLALKNREY